MGAPTSSVFSEIYLQYIQNTEIYNLLLKYHIVGYFRYVDHILIIYRESTYMTSLIDLIT